MAKSYAAKNASVPQCPSGLFDNIITAIKLEKELRQTKRILAVFVSLFLISCASLPFSLTFFVEQWRKSDVSYFIWMALENLDIFFKFRQSFLLSIAESMPIAAMVLILINLSLLLFTVRLFLYKNGLLIKYLTGHARSFAR